MGRFILAGGGGWVGVLWGVGVGGGGGKKIIVVGGTGI